MFRVGPNLAQTIKQTYGQNAMKKKTERGMFIFICIKKNVIFDIFLLHNLKNTDSDDTSSRFFSLCSGLHQQNETQKL